MLEGWEIAALVPTLGQWTLLSARKSLDPAPLLHSSITTCHLPGVQWGSEARVPGLPFSSFFFNNSICIA